MSQKYYASFRNKKFTGLHTFLNDQIRQESDEIIEVTLENLSREVQKRENPTIFDEWLKTLENLDVEKFVQTKSEKIVNQLDELSQQAQKKIGEKLKFLAAVFDKNLKEEVRETEKTDWNYNSVSVKNERLKIKTFSDSVYIQLDHFPVVRGTLIVSIFAIAHNSVWGTQTLRFDMNGDLILPNQSTVLIKIPHGNVNFETGEIAIVLEKDAISKIKDFNFAADYEFIEK